MLYGETKNIISKSKQNLPGLLLAIVLGSAALTIASHFGLPSSLLAVFSGMVLSFLSTKQIFDSGLRWTSKTVLRIGIALLGLRMGFEDFGALGWQVLLMIIAAMSITIIVGILLARALGLREDYGALTAGSLSICGASAAMAIAAVLPDHKNKTRDVGLTVVCVTGFSTLGIILYPAIAHFMGFDTVHSAMLIGGMMHDVAQTAAAGYAVSDEVGELAVLTKMIRVAFLFPVVLSLMFYFAHQMKKNAEHHTAKANVPFFLIMFFVLMAVNSVLPIPTEVTEGVGVFSKFALITALSAVGLRTHLKQIIEVGIKPFILMIAEVLTLLTIVLSSLFFL